MNKDFQPCAFRVVNIKANSFRHPMRGLLILQEGLDEGEPFQSGDVTFSQCWTDSLLQMNPIQPKQFNYSPTFHKSQVDAFEQTVSGV